MTKEQYLELKNELKQHASNIKFLKKSVRTQNSDLVKKHLGSWDILHRTRIEQKILSRNYRTKHIFMSLIRGKTREQIENNFNTQLPKNGLCSWLEGDIKRLCEKYNLEYDQDENYKIIKIIKVLEKREAA